jgi:4-hydroxy-2-oxoheptanedioate aldolase
MVETRAALDALDGILETPGIDGIFLGPSDFSIAWTDGRTVDSTLEEMMETVAWVAARSREAGKHAAIYVIDPVIAGRVVKMGYQLLAMGSEHSLLALGARTLLADVKKSIGN